ncbi:MAG: Xaa-Pro aminopeptidase [Candidatus Kapaibacterium sp.]|nr:MAG: Xaa-Pro aminopeptidase [Candidatus Kapabacteria bacterium]
MQRLLTFCLVVCSCTAQVLLPYPLDTPGDGIPPEVYRGRRAQLLSAHTERSVILLLSADVRNRQNDVDYEYRQNSNLLYVTGCTEPRCALLLVPGGIRWHDSIVNEVFFIPPRDPEREVWSGVQMGPDEAERILQIRPTLAYASLPAVLDSVLAGKDTLYIASGLPTPSVLLPIWGTRIDVERLLRDSLQKRYPNLVVRTSLRTLAAMRQHKDTHEVRLLRRAIEITLDAFEATMRAARPGMNEYELEALMEYHFRRAGAEDVGYPSIVGSGYNSCILHYQKNRRTTQVGDLVLADCGAEYHGYTADITRTFPISGRFTPEQRALYLLVLEAQDSAIAAAQVGAPFRATHRAAESVIARGLMELGIISSPAEVRRYFMHGTSHYLGLDVHDAGTYGPLSDGTVITVEPGIYIPPGSPCPERWWNIGIRIEDDILVTERGPINLSARLARHPDAIEVLMQSR